MKPDGGLHPDACPHCYTDQQPGFEQPHERDCPRRARARCDDAALVDLVAQRLWQVRPVTAENLHAIVRLLLEEVAEWTAE